MGERQERPLGQFACALVALLGVLFLFLVLRRRSWATPGFRRGNRSRRVRHPIPAVRVTWSQRAQCADGDPTATGARPTPTVPLPIFHIYSPLPAWHRFDLHSKSPAIGRRASGSAREGRKHLLITLSEAGKPPEIHGSKGGKVTGFPADFLEQDLFDDMVFSANGNTLVVVSRDTGVVRLCDLTTGNKETLACPYGGRSQGTKVVYSNDGTLFATAYPNLGIAIWDADKRTERRRLPLNHEKVGDMAFVDGSRAIVAAVETGHGRSLAVRWELFSTERSRVVDLGRVSDPVISPDGRYGVLTDDSVHGVMCDLAAGAKRSGLTRGVGGCSLQMGRLL